MHELIGGYRIEQVLGEGGMGTVYLGRHEVLGRLAAIKVLLPELSSSHEMVTRFFNEARTTALIRHPGLVDVYELGHLPDGRVYMVMEYLEGETLAAMLDRHRRLPLDVAVSLARQIAAALAVAHRRGVVHRDLKPDNVFVVRDEETEAGLRARVLDFGVAKLSQELAGQGLRTRTGSILGTPLYMSPEQCRGAGDIDGRTDVYSLGCMLFEMTTGQRLFDAEGIGEIIGAHLYVAPRPPSQLEPSLPPWLDAVVARALAKRPDDRHASMEELIIALGGRPRSLPPTAMAAAATSRPPTTFGRANGEALRPPPVARRVWLPLVATVAGGVAVLIALRAPREAPLPAPTPQIAVAAPPPPAPLPVPTVPSPPQPDARPAQVTLLIRSAPPGATVIDARTHERLGVTPLELRRERAVAPVILELELADHHPGRIEIAGDRDADHEVALTRKKPKRPRPSRSATIDPFEE